MGTGFVVLYVLLAAVLVVAWIVLPFALFGTKDILRAIHREQQRTNFLLEQLTAALKRRPEDQA